MSYTKTAKALHWLMAAMLFGLLALGFYMHDLPLSPEKLKLYSWHKWAGVTAFLLVAFRLFWRLAHRPPVLPASMPTHTRLLLCTSGRKFAGLSRGRVRNSGFATPFE